MDKKWTISKHPDYRTLRYIETGDGALGSTVNDDEWKREQGLRFRMAAKAPEMYELLLCISDIEHASPVIRAECEKIFQYIDEV